MRQKLQINKNILLLIPLIYILIKSKNKIYIYIIVIKKKHIKNIVLNNLFIFYSNNNTLYIS